MSTVAELQAQIAALQAQVEEAKKAEQADAIAQCKALIAQYDLTERQLFSKRGAPKAGVKAPAKYRDPISGKTWSGKGRTPLWMAGKSKEDFAI